MADLGVFSVENLQDLMYKTNGEPIEVQPTPTWSYGKKRTWLNYCLGDHPDYQEDADREDQEHEEYLETMRQQDEEAKAEHEARFADPREHTTVLAKADQEEPHVDSPLAVESQW
jgi:hypothetical protein